VLELVLQKKQLIQLRKYNEFKIPILMHSLFEDNGLPDLQRVQRVFHHAVMRGLLTENEKLLKLSYGTKKDQEMVKAYIRERLPEREVIQRDYMSYKPIKDAVLPSYHSSSVMNE